MKDEYFRDKEFKGVDFGDEDLKLGSYEHCQFINCNFTASTLVGFQFSNCSFTNCDLSNIKILDAIFDTVYFKACKLIGLRFETCNDFVFSADFNGCLLSYSTFSGMDLRGRDFTSSRLIETEFTDTNLTAAIFKEADLSGAVFERSNLEKADFRSATNFNIDPEKNRMKGAKFSHRDLPSLLSKYKLDID